MTDNFDTRQWVYLGWNCIVYIYKDTWYYEVLDGNGKRKRAGNAYSVSEAILSAFSGCESLGELTADDIRPT